MAAGDLTTLAVVKDWLGLSVPGDDMKLARLITAVSVFIQSWLNRQLASASYTETRNGTGTRRISLVNYPVTAVASVTLDGVVLDPTTYVWDQYGVELTGGVFCRGVGNVVVAYTAGFATIPADIQQACVELVTLRYQRRLRPDVTSKTQGTESVSYGAADMPKSIADLLMQYKRVVQP